MKSETFFRRTTVDPYLKDLAHAFFISIQQVSLRGSPDKLGVINGFFVALELKSDGKLPTPLQDFILTRITKAGGVALAVRPDNWNRITPLLWGLSQGAITPKQIGPWRDYLCSP